MNCLGEMLQALRRQEGSKHLGCDVITMGRCRHVTWRIEQERVETALTEQQSERRRDLVIEGRPSDRFCVRPKHT